MTAEARNLERLVETYKQQLREAPTKDGRQFGDSFQEVMQDEMMTMKMAFEAKLRAARDEVEAVSRKHQGEIQRIQAKSAATAPAPPASSSSKQYNTR